MEALLPFLIVCPLVFVAGFVDAIAGGGGLISLPAYLISGLPVHTALGTNKMSSLMGTSLATWRYARHGFVNLRCSAVCAAFALVGSALGANVALLVSDGVFKLIMLVVVPLTGCYIMFHKGFGEAREPLAPTRTLALCTAISFAMGLYDGFYGPGTGTFLILLFMAAAHLTLDEAAGTAKVVNLTTNVAAFSVFALHGSVWLPLGLTAGLFNMVGAWIGTSFFIGKGVRVTRPIMLVVLAVFFVKLIWDLVAGAA